MNKESYREDETYVNCLFGCPSVPEEGDRNEASEEYTSRQSHLRLEDATIGFGHPDNCGIANLCYHSKA
jgi:hypothetical protein